MPDSKAIFLKDQDLREQLAAVVHADWFQRALAFAKAELMEMNDLTSEHLAGARKFERILMDLPELPQKEPEFPSSGLKHNLDISPRKPKDKKEQPKK